jgi:hypothetical protein
MDFMERNKPSYLLDPIDLAFSENLDIGLIFSYANTQVGFTELSNEITSEHSYGNHHTSTILADFEPLTISKLKYASLLCRNFSPKSVFL